MRTTYEFDQALEPGADSADWMDGFVDEAIAALEEDFDYSVIGPTDDRFQIAARHNRPSTLLFPFNTICFLEAQLESSFEPWCTGTLIAPQVVLTAKHCLEGVARIRVNPGVDFSATTERNRRPASPTSITADSNRFRFHPTLDYGVIILPQRFRRPNQFMRLQARRAPGTATLLTIAGYPCDKPVGTMWGHSNRIPLTGVTATHLHYTIDTCPGHSGSPIWLLGNAGIRLLLGVHTSGAGGCENDPIARCLPTGAPVSPVAGQNSGVRVTCNVIDTIRQWCREFRVQGPVVDSYSRLCP